MVTVMVSQSTAIIDLIVTRAVSAIAKLLVIKCNKRSSKRIKGRICLAEHSVSCSAAARRPSSTLSAQCRKAQYWVRCCSLSTQRTLQL